MLLLLLLTCDQEERAFLFLSYCLPGLAGYFGTCTQRCTDIAQVGENGGLLHWVDWLGGWMNVCGRVLRQSLTTSMTGACISLQEGGEKTHMTRMLRPPGLYLIPKGDWPRSSLGINTTNNANPWASDYQVCRRLLWPGVPCSLDKYM